MPPLSQTARAAARKRKKYGVGKKGSSQKEPVQEQGTSNSEGFYPQQRLGSLDSFDQILRVNLKEYKIVGGDSAVFEIWESMSKEKKRELISLQEDSIMASMNRLLAGDIIVQNTPSEAVVSAVQAIFLHAMEVNEGIISLEETSIETVAVVMALEDRLLLEKERRDIYRKCTFVTLYFIWISRLGWMGTFAGIFIAVSEVDVCKNLRSLFCKAVDTFLIQSEDPSLVHWQSDTYITALLMLYIASGTEAYVAVAILLLIPYILRFIESNQTLSRSSADKKSMKTIRNMMSYFNKLILVYYAWGQYTSLILVAILFFYKVSTSLIYIGLLTSGFIVTYLTKLATIVIPNRIQYKYLIWKSKWYNQILLLIAPIFFAFSAVWYTWEWEAPWGGIVRSLIVVTTFHLLPVGLFTVLLQLGLLALAVPIYLINLISKKYIDVISYLSGTDSKPSNQQKYEYNDTKEETEK